MTAVGTPPAPGSAAGVVRPTRPDVLGVVRSEWTKIRSVRSTYWTLAVTVVAIIGLGSLITWATEANWTSAAPHDRATFDSASTTLVGITFGQLAIVVLGVMVISAEYSSGMIRTTFAAVPNRPLVLLVKGAVFGAVAFVVGLVASFVAYFIGHAILASNPQVFAESTVPHELSNGDVLRAVFGGGLYLLALGVFAFGIGALLRHTAGGIATVIGILLVLPLLANFLPGNWNHDVTKYLPMPAGFQIWSVSSSGVDLAPWAGFGVLCGYAVAAMALALFAVNRRDA